MSRQFKVGDRVRIGPENGVYSCMPDHGVVPGNTGTVVAINRWGAYLVRTDNATRPAPNGKPGWTFAEKHLEPVE